MSHDYRLPAPNEAARRLAAGWLKLGVLALLASGAFSILLVLSRTPKVHAFIPWVDFFHTALVVHVDLSVVIWFLAFAGVFWSYNSHGSSPLWDRLALLLTGGGTLVITVAPFLGAGQPLMNNYIPVLQHPLFFTGGGLVAAGFLLLIIRGLLSRVRLDHDWLAADSLRVGLFYSKIAALLAMLGFLVSYLMVPADMQGESYYEFLFWGGGHMLQFTHSLLLLVAWLWLASASGLRVPLAGHPAVLLFGLAFVPVLMGPVIYLVNDVVSAGHREGFTQLMRWGGLSLLPLGLVVLISLFRGSATTTAQRPLRSALHSSLILFTAGGVLGFLIHGVNVVIPAHYHGSIVGVTLAFMGMAYLLLPQLGFAEPMPRTARIQPYVYGGGQLMHIIGLAVSGGYGNIQRKTAGTAQGLDNLPEILGMGLMGLGGLVSILGGLLFVIVMVRAIWFPGTQQAGR